MNTPTNTSQPSTLLDVFVDELIATPDADVLDGMDAEAARMDGLRILDAAKAQAGKRRLVAAKAGAAAAQARGLSVAPADVSAMDARKFLAEAANDPRFTLAARLHSDMSDEEVLRLYAQVMGLAMPLETRKDGSE